MAITKGDNYADTSAADVGMHTKSVLSDTPNIGQRKISRRSALLAASVGMAAFAGFSAPASAGAPAKIELGIKALTFDIYGTCTNYWEAFVREGMALNLEKNLHINWADIFTQMGGPFPPTLVQLLKKQRPWQSISSLRRESLEQTLNQNGYANFSEDEIARLNRIWTESDAWPDTAPALSRLKDRFLLTTLGNADLGDTTRLIKRNKLPFDLILASELAHSVKPDPAVYQLASELLNLQPHEILMVACHKVDLRAAASQGFKTAFVARPLEAGPQGHPDTKPESEFEFNARSLDDLADQLLI